MTRRRVYVPERQEQKPKDEFEKAAASTRYERLDNPAKRKDLKKSRMKGLSRFIGGSQTAVLAAVANGVSHLYAIARIYGMGEPNVYRRMQDLVKGNLIERCKSETAAGQQRIPYALTETGREIVELMEGSGDAHYRDCRRWVALNRADH
jgi:DNA-binding MarR family transcriptional regulator